MRHEPLELVGRPLDHSPRLSRSFEADREGAADGAREEACEEGRDEELRSGITEGGMYPSRNAWKGSDESCADGEEIEDTGGEGVKDIPGARLEDRDAFPRLPRDRLLFSLAGSEASCSSWVS